MASAKLPGTPRERATESDELTARPATRPGDRRPTQDGDRRARSSARHGADAKRQMKKTMRRHRDGEGGNCHSNMARPAGGVFLGGGGG